MFAKLFGVPLRLYRATEGAIWSTWKAKTVYKELKKSGVVVTNAAIGRAMAPHIVKRYGAENVIRSLAHRLRNHKCDGGPACQQNEMDEAILMWLRDEGFIELIKVENPDA